MRILKPLWLNHGGEKKDFEVYSCHVSPDGIRLVTAAGDTYVRIWSTEAIYNAQNVQFTKPKQLAALSYHSGTILTVRFSGNNRYLASGADDRIVCVYHLDPTPPSHTTFGSTEAPPVENWRIFRRLIGHDNDVQDLGWSCDSSILVSVGLDSKIVVWSGYTFEKLKTLSLHGSHVKGITFDPANKYFATASDDRTIKIFRYTSPLPNHTSYDQTNNFTLEHTISTPFALSPLTTYFRRCSWSPDGNHIGAVNAVNGQVSTAAIINRGTWDSDINLIGHEAPTEVCCFSPRMFSKVPINKMDPDDPARNTVTVVALGGQDRAITVWNTMSPKPLAVNEGLCLKSVSDLAWSPEGEHLFFTSLDGTIGVILFMEGELGYPVPLEVNESSLAKYGAGRKVGVVEGPDGLLLEEISKNDEFKTVQGRMGELMGDAAEATQSDLTTTAKVSQTNGLVNGSSKAATDVSTATNGHAQGEAPAASISHTDDPNTVRVERLKQRVTITKDGKKRVAPVLVSSSAGGMESSLPRSQLVSSTDVGARMEAPQAILDLSKPFEGLPKGGLASLLVGSKRRYAETGAEDDDAIAQTITGTQREGAVPIVTNTADGLTIPNTDSMLPPIPNRPSILNPSLVVSQLRLAIPTIRTQIQRPLNGILPDNNAEPNKTNSSGDDTHMMEIRNPSGPSRTGRPQDREPARVTVTKRGQVLWQDFLPKAVLCVTGNTKFWAAACEDGSLYVWSPAGRRLFNAFALEAQPAIVDCRGPWLMCITAVGLCHVWNIATSSSPHQPVSLAPVLDIAAFSQGPHLTAGPSIIFARMTSEGRIIVAMSNGEGYAYSTSMFVWQRLSEPWWAVGSQYWNSTERASNTQVSSAARPINSEDDDLVRPENVSAGIIPLLERNTTSQTLLRGRAYFLQRLIKILLSAEGYEGFESGVSVAHLENRLAAALMLGARDEFKIYLNMYAKRLGAEGSRLKVEELLRNLVSGVFEEPSNGAQDGDQSAELCGWKKRTLLHEVVIILGKYRDLQRITIPYSRLLGLTGDGGPEDTNQSMVDA